MAMTKADYEAQGKRVAQQDLLRSGEPSECGLKAGTWQAKAWKEGYDLAMKVGKKAPPQARHNGDHASRATAALRSAYRREPAVVPRESVIVPPWRAVPVVRTLGWDQAAAEHLRLLELIAAKTPVVKRYERACRSMRRMDARHNQDGRTSCYPTQSRTVE